MPGKDHRTRVTKMLIRRAFTDLLRVKPVQSISIKELCEKAGVNRGTFYAHYQSVHDLLVQMEDEMLAEINEVLSALLPADGKDVSWIWDAQIDIGDHVGNVYAFGIRSGDMALRLKYAGIQAKIIKNYDEFKKITFQPDTVIIPTYTAMMALRPYFAHRSGKKEFWQ